MIQQQASILCPSNVHWDHYPFEDNIEGSSGIIETLHTLVSSGTETSIFQGTHPLSSEIYPYFPGYASIGKIICVSKEERKFKINDLVFFPGKHQKYTDLSIFYDSCIFVREDEVEYAPLIRFGQISYTVLDVLGESCDFNNLKVATIGLGLIGNLTSQILKNYGASVTGIDHHQYRVEIALDCGIDDAVVPSIGSKLTLHTEYDLVIEASGSCAGISNALSLVKYGGTVVLLGSPKEPCLIDFYLNVHRKCVRIIGAHEGCLSREKRRHYSEKFLNLLRTQSVKTSRIISHYSSPKDLRKAYHQLINSKDHTLSIRLDWENSD
jgi:bacteriochlorophyllide a dehydrogenase